MDVAGCLSHRPAYLINLRSCQANLAEHSSILQDGKIDTQQEQEGVQETESVSFD